MFDAFASYLREQDRSERTVAGYLHDLTLFAQWFRQTNGDELTPQRLTPTDVREYRQHLLRSGAKPSTLNRRLSAIRAYVTWARRSGQIETDPTNGIKGVEEQEIAPRWLDRREQAALLREVERELSAAQTEAAKRQALRDRALVLLLLHSGLRISELCALRIEDVELSERKGKVVVRQGKGAKRREIPLNNTARAALREWLSVRPADGERLFAGKRGEGLSPSGVHRRLAEFGRRAGIELSPHTLRHTFAKNLVDAGVTLEKVAALLGHSSLNTTRVYTTPGEKDLEKAVESLD